MSSSTSTQSGPLSDDDVASLESLVGQIISQFLVLGIHTTLFVIAISLLVSRGLKNSRARFVLLCATTVMFVDALIADTLTMINQTAFIRSLGNNPPTDTNLELRLAIALDSLLRLNYILSDAIVVWRAWIFWPRNTVVRAILTLCMMATIGTSVADMTRIALQFLGRGPEVGPGAPSLLLSFAPLFTNVVATLLIGIKAWLYRRDVLMNLGPGKSRPIQKVFFLLVESGLLYCMLWVFLLADNLISTDIASEISSTVTGMSISLSGAYPTIIIILVSLEKSYADTIYSQEPDTVLSQPIHFKRGDTSTMMDTAGNTDSTMTAHPRNQDMGWT